MQHQQHMAGGIGSVRPPPPEYKAAAQAQMMHAGIGMGQQPRFPNAGNMRRVTQQPMPPSGNPTNFQPTNIPSSEFAFIEPSFVLFFFFQWKSIHPF